MKRYTTESVSAIISSMAQELPVLELFELHQSIKQVWQMLPDERLRALPLTLHIDEQRRLVISTPSTVHLSYLRAQRPLIEEHLAPHWADWKITALLFMQSRR